MICKLTCIARIIKISGEKGYKCDKLKALSHSRAIDSFSITGCSLPQDTGCCAWKKALIISRWLHANSSKQWCAGAIIQSFHLACSSKAVLKCLNWIPILFLSWCVSIIKLWEMFWTTVNLMQILVLFTSFLKNIYSRMFS